MKKSLIGAALLVWTTTPWTLPSNLAACVNPDLVYARFEQKSTKKVYIMLESRIEQFFAADDFKVIKTFLGNELKGLQYQPVFEYFSNLKPKPFVVLVDDYVTAESGKVYEVFQLNLLLKFRIFCQVPVLYIKHLTLAKMITEFV